MVIRPVENIKAERWPARNGPLIWWLLPIAFLFWLYSTGLRTWFLADDFAWLGLLRVVHSVHDVLSVLFTPAAQGTIRPWSERGFFLLFESLFGLNSLPFRITVFATMTANFLLIVWITCRITGSLMAGSLAAILWTANAALVTVMAWNSSYNEAMCSLFLLSSLALFIRYAETGRRRFWWWQLVVFVLGFGALEINVVYQALAAAYVLFIAPKVRRKPHLLQPGAPRGPGGYWPPHTCVAWLGVIIEVSRISSRWWLDQSVTVRGLVLGVEGRRRLILANHK